MANHPASHHISDDALASQFKEHLAIVTKRTYEAMAALSIDELIIDAGEPMVPMFDTHAMPFTASPYFRYFCPDERPSSICHLVPGQKPTLYRFTPIDFWYDVTPVQGAWQQSFNVQLEGDMGPIWDGLKKRQGVVHYIGNNTDRAKACGFIVNDESLLARMHWHRTQKTAYEVSCLKEANRIAALGHKRVYDGFCRGENEFELYLAFLNAVQQTPEQLPYNAIIAADTKSAVLHYEHKRFAAAQQVLLIDAGARFRGYGSDITRTYILPEAKSGVDYGARAVFASLIEGLNQAQLRLVAQIKPGVSYGDLHKNSHHEVYKLLADHDILRGVSSEEALANQFTQAFYPHGLGHMLGLLVHDVGGQQLDEKGTPCKPYPEFPKLRTARPLKVDEVITCEPGLYFIPMLLDACRHDDRGKRINWPLVDALIPFGGIRIEDDILVTQGQPENLTRPYLP